MAMFACSSITEFYDVHYYTVGFLKGFKDNHF